MRMRIFTMILAIAGLSCLTGCPINPSTATTQLSTAQVAEYNVAQAYTLWTGVSQGIDSIRIADGKLWSDPKFAPIKAELLEAKTALDAADAALTAGDSAASGGSLAIASKIIASIQATLQTMQSASATPLATPAPAPAPTP
jgi:hypothetical protein